VSGWATPNAQWRAWLEEDVLSVAPVAVIDEFDRELRGVLDGLFGVTLEVTSVGSPRTEVHEDSMTTLVRHRDDVTHVPGEPPEEFDAASTLVHAAKVDDGGSGFDVSLQTPGGGLQVELEAHPPPEDAGFYIPALTESAKIVVGGPVPASARIETPDANPTVGVPELVPSESAGVPTPLTAPTIGAPTEGVVRVESMSAATALDSGPMAWASPDPTPVPQAPAFDEPPHVVPVGDAGPPVRTGTTLVPTEAPAAREPVAASSQTAGVIVSLLDDEDAPPQPPRRSSKIVVASESTSSGIVADVYDDSGEYPRPVPNEPLDETELEDDDLDAELDSAEVEQPTARPRPPAPKPAVKLVPSEQPPPPPRAEPKPEPRIEAKAEPGPPPPPQPNKAEAKHEGPPPPPVAAKAEPRHEGPPPPPPARAPEPGESRPEAARVPDRPRPVEEITPRVRTLPGITGPHWSDEVFTEHFFALVRPGEARIAATEVEFLQQAMGLAPGATVIDVGCGDGWHAQLLTERGMRVVGLDVSQAMIQRAKELADQHGVRVRWVLGDVRQHPVDETFDAVLSLGTSFGYDDDATNRRTLAALRDLVRVGGRLALHVMNRDYVVPRLPARSWWQGERCLVLDEVDMQDWTSRVRVRRTIVFEDGQQFEHTLSIRVYALHELIELLEGQGLRVVEVSGSPHTRGRFYGATSPDIWVIAERVDDR